MNSSTTSVCNHSITSRPIKPGIFCGPLRQGKFAAAKHLLLCSVFYLLLVSNQVAAQYCAAGATDNMVEKISNVTFNTINNSSSSTSGYENFTAVSTVVEQGNIYAFSATISGAFSNDQLLVWIDYNHDGVFNNDATERVFLSGNLGQSGQTFTTNITISNSASLGATRMRVRLQRNTTLAVTNTTPCGDSTYGQVEDYTININACSSSAPAPGNTVSTVTPPVCPSTAFTLSFQNSQSSGTTYQWQSSPDNSTWTNISGATNPTHAVAGIITATYYRCRVSNCNSTVNSTPLQVTTMTCYCTAGATITSNEKINNVAFNTINNPSSSTGGYEDFTAVSTTVQLGNTYPFTASIFNAFSGGGDQVIVWIDFNGDLDFDDLGELVFTSAVVSSLSTGAITIPSGVSTGATRMRVRLHRTTFEPNNTPCGNSTVGQVEDYTVNIVTCSTSAPSPGNTAFSAAACQVTFSLQNSLIIGTGYQWQSSPDNSTWTNIGGAINPTYSLTSIPAATWYRCQTTTCGGQANSNPLQMPVTFCYCAATGGTNERISNVTFNSINNSSSSSSPAVYEDFTSVSTMVEKGNTYPFSASISAGPFSETQLLVWIDFNHDGVFNNDASEKVFTSVLGGPFSSTINIPTDAAVGPTQMRVRVHRANQGGSSNSTPCGSSQHGQVEDYTVNIAPCSGALVPGNTLSSVASPVCTGGVAQSFTLSFQNSLPSGTTYQWQSSPNNSSWTNISGATNTTYTVPRISATTWYRCQVTNCAGSASSNPLQMTTIPCYCTAGGATGSSDDITNVTFHAINNNSSVNTMAFEDFTSISTNVERGNTYAFSATISTVVYNMQIIAWIDFNQDGDFTDAGEQIFIFPSPSTVTSVQSGIVTIPAGATLGNTRMRVRLHRTSSGANSTSCGNSGFGQVEDYTVNIAPCSGALVPGNTLSSVASLVCPSTAFTLSLQNVLPSGSTAYQWQSSPDNSTWSNINGATNATRLVSSISSNTWFRCQVSNCGGVVNSTALQMTVEGTMVKNTANSGLNSLRSVYGCIQESGTITYDLPTTNESILTEPLNISKSVIIQGLSNITRPQITISAAGINISNGKTLTLQNVDLKSNGTATFTGNGTVNIIATTLVKQ